MASPERELQILENIYHNGSRVRQRDLARVVGLSLGMTNVIVKRLAHKGWLAIRKVNNRNIRYAVTSSGADEIARRSYRYFKRTIKNVVDYKDAIEKLVAGVRHSGYDTVVLVGSSDLDFVVEHVCAKSGVRFERGDGGPLHDGRFRLISERRRRPAQGRDQGEEPASRETGVAYLRDILA